MPGIVSKGVVSKSIKWSATVKERATPPSRKNPRSLQEKTHIRYQLYYSNLRSPKIQSIKPSGATGFVGTGATYILLLACAE
jgi:hypothetical protein